MKILFKQADGAGSLAKAGVRSCYFKMLLPDHDTPLITKKDHHHSTYELHVVTHGAQYYELDGKRFTVRAGEYLLISPMLTHRIAGTAPGTRKFSLSFANEVAASARFQQGTLTERMRSSLEFAAGEAVQKKQFSPLLLENAVTELIITVLRQAGLKERQAPLEKTGENATLTLAKKYIDDNITRAPTVAAVAAYCHLSPKQLTRIFTRFENATPADYIATARIARIERLLSDSALSLAQISEQMNFSSEYYLNAFFKKHAGMPPGQYRKMLG